VPEQAANRWHITLVWPVGSYFAGVLVFIGVGAGMNAYGRADSYIHVPLLACCMTIEQCSVMGGMAEPSSLCPPVIVTSESVRAIVPSPIVRTLLTFSENLLPLNVTACSSLSRAATAARPWRCARTG